MFEFDYFISLSVAGAVRYLNIMKYFVTILYISTIINLHGAHNVWKLPKPQYKIMVGQVCGSNFETFATYDRFVEARDRIKDLVILHPGPCNRLCQIYWPVCGNNGITYHNICHLEYAKMRIQDLKLDRNGRCDPRRDIAMDYYDDTLRSGELDTLADDKDKEVQTSMDVVF